MNNILKQAGAILSLSLLCGMQVYAFPDYPSLRGQIIEQSDICQGVVKDANGESIIRFFRSSIFNLDTNSTNISAYKYNHYIDNTILNSLTRVFGPY